MFGIMSEMVWNAKSQFWGFFNGCNWYTKLDVHWYTISNNNWINRIIGHWFTYHSNCDFQLIPQYDRYATCRNLPCTHSYSDVSIQEVGFLFLKFYARIKELKTVGKKSISMFILVYNPSVFKRTMTLFLEKNIIIYPA